MKITVTIRTSIIHKDYDIQIDDRQKIKTTLRILKENLPEVLMGLEEPVKVQSCRSKRRLNINESYREANIYSCDILTLFHIEQ